MNPPSRRAAMKASHTGALPGVAGTIASHPTRYTFPAGCASATSLATKAEARVVTKTRRVITESLRPPAGAATAGW